MRRSLARGAARPLLALAACALAGCAHATDGQRNPATKEEYRPATREQHRIDISEPLVITAGPPAQVALGDMDEATLFDGGSRAFAAGEFEKAATHFERLADAFPQGGNLLPALWNAGLARERLGQWTLALDRFTSYLARDSATARHDDVDAQFHAAVAEYKLGRLDDAAARLHRLSERADLPAARKGEALLQEGVCRVEAGKRDEGEKLLRAAIALYDKDDAVDPALPAQAEFWMGEVYRGYFGGVQLDPSTMDEEKLGATLEAKAEFLLSAQGHFLRAIRRGDGEWATAAGFRIGELYEQFHDELVGAPLPRGLNEELRSAYQQALREKVRNLVGKAIRIYEQTLATAQRVGASSGYVQKTEAALERLKKLMLGTN